MEPQPRFDRSRAHIRIVVGPSNRCHTRVDSYRFAAGRAVISVTDTSGRPVELEPHHYLWHVWRGPARPLTAAAEATFVADLEAAAAAVDPQPLDEFAEDDRRADITTVMNALRCGLSAAGLLREAPGEDPHRLLDAYRRVERIRADAAEAWERLAANPDLATFEQHADSAVLLAPVPVRRLATATSEAKRRQLTGELLREIAQVAGHVAKIEAVLDAGRHPERWLVEIGRLLYDPYDVCLFAHPYHIPARVGALCPSRLRDLLQEQTP